MGVQRVDGALRVDVSPDAADGVTRALAAGGQWVTELRPERFSLEDVFLELTRSGNDEDSDVVQVAETEEVVA